MHHCAGQACRQYLLLQAEWGRAALAVGCLAWLMAWPLPPQLPRGSGLLPITGERGSWPFRTAPPGPWPRQA